MDESGTKRSRPSEWGPELTSDWWDKASDALIKRLIGYGGGEGPPPDQRTRLSKGLQIIFRAPTSDDLGESAVRSFLRADSESTDTLAITLGDVLAARCGSLVLRQLAEPPSAGEERPSAPSAAIDKSKPKRPPALKGERGVRRPKPSSQSKEPDALIEPGWWQKVIDAREANFEAEWQARERIYEDYLAALDPPQQEKFMEDPAVRPNRLLWEGRYKRAVAFSALAIGIRKQDLDDAYHFSTIEEVPASMRSQRLLGELVHAAWQFDYLDAEPHSRVIAEYMYAVGASPSSGKPFRQKPLRDYRELVGDEENATLFGAAFWAFGKQRPDILDLTKKRIIEIKPVRGAPAGVLQLWRYTHNFNCARLFDELTKAGAEGEERFVIEPQNAPSSYFSAVDVNEFLEAYFAARDEEKQKRSRRSIPAGRRRVGRTEVERSIRAGRKLKVVPFMMPDLPGLLMYFVHEDESEKKSEDLLPSAQALVGVVVVVTAVVLITAVLFAIAALPVAAGAAAVGSTAIAEGAVATEVAAGAAGATAEAAVLETFGAGFRISEFAQVAEEVGNIFESLNAAGVTQ